jgi:DNA-binding GntR family transcriptional regulator
MATEEKPAGAPMRDSVREAIRTLVIDGELRPGERLGVSRVPVREALRQLAHEGLAEERPTRGMVVRQLDDDAVEELFEVRAALEAILCRRVVDRASEEGFDRLDATVAQADAALAGADERLAVHSNADFHEVLLELAESPVLTAVMAPVAGRMRWLLSQHEDPAAMNADHAAIAYALRQRDLASAKRLCREHLASSRRAVAAGRRTR